MINPQTATRNAPLLPVEVQTFANEDDRRRLTAPALRAYRKLAKQWRLQNDDAASLLGVSTSTWDRIKRDDWAGALSQDQLTRVSAVVGVFKGLHLLFANEMADAWPHLVNRGPLFDKRSPIDAMKSGGIPMMLDVRRYIDAVRGGL